MEPKSNLSSSYKLLITVIVVLVVSDACLVVAVGWLFAKIQQHEAEIERLKHSKTSEQAVLVKKLSSTSHHEEVMAENPVKREVLGDSGTVNIMDLLKGGIRGPPGTPGKDGRDGRDAVNFQAVDKHINITVAQVVGLEMTKVRLAAKEIPTVAGIVYIRWGRTSCPSSSRLISKGVAAGTAYYQKGGGSQHLCLPDDPDYHTKASMPVEYSTISAAEYQAPIAALFGKNILWHNAPCSYCQTDGRAQKLILPAKINCPSNWTREYEGFLMSERAHESHNRNSFICVDSNAESIPGPLGFNRGALLNHVVSICSGDGTLGYCPPYREKIAMSCVVCTR